MFLFRGCGLRGDEILRRDDDTNKKDPLALTTTEEFGGSPQTAMERIRERQVRRDQLTTTM
jgi:hypothetical protein